MELQYAYEAYGKVIEMDEIVLVDNRAGHHGLFFDRFNSSYGAPFIKRNSIGLYDARNRSYDQTLGRCPTFATMDPASAGSRPRSSGGRSLQRP